MPFFIDKTKWLDILDLAIVTSDLLFKIIKSRKSFFPELIGCPSRGPSLKFYRSKPNRNFLVRVRVRFGSIQISYNRFEIGSVRFRTLLQKVLLKSLPLLRMKQIFSYKNLRQISFVSMKFFVHSWSSCIMFHILIPLKAFYSAWALFSNQILHCSDIWSMNSIQLTIVYYSKSRMAMMSHCLSSTW